MQSLSNFCRVFQSSAESVNYSAQTARYMQSLQNSSKVCKIVTKSVNYSIKSANYSAKFVGYSVEFVSYFAESVKYLQEFVKYLQSLQIARKVCQFLAKSVKYSQSLLNMSLKVFLKIIVSKNLKIFINYFDYFKNKIGYCNKSLIFLAIRLNFLLRIWKQ